MTKSHWSYQGGKLTFLGEFILINTQKWFIRNVLLFCVFCAVLCVCFYTGHFVMVSFNLTCLHCYFFFAHKLDLSTLFTTFFLWTSPPFILWFWCKTTNDQSLLLIWISQYVGDVNALLECLNIELLTNVHYTGKQHLTHIVDEIIIITLKAYLLLKHIWLWIFS